MLCDSLGCRYNRFWFSFSNQEETACQFFFDLNKHHGKKRPSDGKDRGSSQTKQAKKPRKYVDAFFPKNFTGGIGPFHSFYLRLLSCLDHLENVLDGVGVQQYRGMNSHLFPRNLTVSS